MSPQGPHRQPHPLSVSPLSAAMSYENVGGVGDLRRRALQRDRSWTSRGEAGRQKDTVLKPQVAFLGISPPTHRNTPMNGIKVCKKKW